jgi:hypothetical protein
MPRGHIVAQQWFLAGESAKETLAVAKRQPRGCGLLLLEEMPSPAIVSAGILALRT